jgi:5,10-methylenetetrahydromethanopterin reductase
LASLSATYDTFSNTYAAKLCHFRNSWYQTILLPPIDDLGLADTPDASQIAWIAGSRKVSVEVTATGPRAIKLAGVHAERVMFALGADTARIKWDMELAKQARLGAGLDPNDLCFGAYVNCVCHQDIDTARMLVRGALSLFARFSVLHGKASGPVPPSISDALQTFQK